MPLQSQSTLPQAIDVLKSCIVLTDIFRSQIGQTFQQAAKFTGARMTANNFDTSIVEVHRNDVVNFFDFLRHSLVEQ